ncbi:MAG TPA: two-component regulator propeller domain-containing protein [Blastocatellia bacterium]|nr:two-component regulator propeller domain-containing protein [Blastocatellia bacterium]
MSPKPKQRLKRATAICVLSISLPQYGAQNSPLIDKSTCRQVAGHCILKVFDVNKTAIDLHDLIAIFQDRAGLYWIGTWRGLHSYDEQRDQWTSYYSDVLRRRSIGASLQVFDLPPLVHWITQRSDNKIWAASGLMEASSLTCFDGEKWHAVKDYLAPLGIKEFSAKASIRTMFLTRDDTLWIGFGDRVLTYDGHKWNLALMTANPGAGLQDSEGNIWLGSDRTIVRLDESGKQLETFDLVSYWARPRSERGKRSGKQPDPSPFGISQEPARDMLSAYEDRKGRIWFGNAEGRIFMYDKRVKKWVIYNVLSEVNGIYQDNSGLMMFGTRAGLETLSESDNSWKVFKVSSMGFDNQFTGGVTAITADRSGRIWLGTRKGIVVLQP